MSPSFLWKRAILAAALGLAASAGLARAEDAETVHPYLLLNPDDPHPVLHLFHLQAPLVCWASHNGSGSGSLLSETVFIFGSSRAFYGEPCLKAPPPPPWSPEADNPPAANSCQCHW